MTAGQKRRLQADGSHGLATLLKAKPDMAMTDPALEAALQLINHGTPDRALAAAKSLGINAIMDKTGARWLEPAGTIRAVMKVQSAMVTPSSPCHRWFLNHNIKVIMGITARYTLRHGKRLSRPFSLCHKACPAKTCQVHRRFR